jgi:hypothetical protein
MKFTPQFEKGALRDLKKPDKPIAIRERCPIILDS